MNFRPRRLTIGLGIGRDTVRAVAVSAGGIACALELVRGDEPLARTIELVLADAPIARWPRPRVIAAVGPAHAQTKRLLGLPPVSDASRLGDVVRESASRFFLRNGVPLVTTWRTSADGVPWAAAIEQPVLEAIESACRTRSVKLTAIVPTVAVLGRGADEPNGLGRITWTDGDLCLDLAFEAGALVAVRRAIGGASQSGQQRNHFHALDALGPDGSRFADALGAAHADPDGVLAWRFRRNNPRRTGPTWRLALAAIAAMVTGAALLGAPGVAARVAERSAMARLTKLAPVRRDVTFAEREFSKLTAALTEVAAFDAPRYPMAVLLADFARALPDESALVTLRLVRDAGNLVVLTPRAAIMLTKLETVPGIESPEIIGPVTRELLAGKTLERVTVRFRVNAAVRRLDRAETAGGQ